MAQKNEYGNALFLLAEEEGAIDKVKDDLITLSSLLKKNPDYVKLLDTPAISKAEKLSLIDGALTPLHYSVVNLLKMLCEKHSVYTFRAILDTYLSLCDEHYGIERVEAVTAIPLSDKQTKTLTDKVAQITGKTVIIKNTVEPGILGGVVLRYAGAQLDGSVKTRLDAFSERLKKLTI